jgi:16S rRNA (uracil1498-N3)-methyltransferase
MNLFYAPELNSNAVHFTLNEEESSHIIRVLRMKAGDKIFLTDGKGFFYESEITITNAKKCQLKIIRSIEDKAKRNFHFTIAIAPTKSIDRFEWFLEKATEIGCDEIIPVHCKHSERTVIKPERLNKVLVSAMKQCLKSQLPKLSELTEFTKFIEKTKELSAQKFIGHIPELDGTEFPPKNPQGKLLAQALLPASSKIIVTIGPEGGFSEEEISLAQKNNFTMISLGNSRLRVETAGVVACSIVNSML